MRISFKMLCAFTQSLAREKLATCTAKAGLVPGLHLHSRTDHHAQGSHQRSPGAHVGGHLVVSQLFQKCNYVLPVSSSLARCLVSSRILTEYPAPNSPQLPAIAVLKEIMFGLQGSAWSGLKGLTA